MARNHSDRLETVPAPLQLRIAVQGEIPFRALSRFSLWRNHWVPPWAMGTVTGAIFHGAAPSAKALTHRSELLNAGGSVKSIFFTCLLIPAIMAARSLVSYGGTYYMNWVSNRAVTDIRNELFRKIINQSMDFFNRMQAGVLMSRISNNTMAMQVALTQV